MVVFAPAERIPGSSMNGSRQHTFIQLLADVREGEPSASEGLRWTFHYAMQTVGNRWDHAPNDLTMSA